MPTRLDQVVDFIGLPPGAIATEAIVVIGYLDSEGHPAYVTSPVGDTSTSGIIGLLNMAAYDMWEQNNRRNQ